MDVTSIDPTENTCQKQGLLYHFLQQNSGLEFLIILLGIKQHWREPQATPFFWMFRGSTQPNEK